MHKNILQHIDHVAIWPVISFVIFFLFFIILLWWVFTADKAFIARMKSLPGDDGTIQGALEAGSGEVEDGSRKREAEDGSGIVKSWQKAAGNLKRLLWRRVEH